jgi:hypothetical protein
MGTEEAELAPNVLLNAGLADDGFGYPLHP